MEEINEQQTKKERREEKRRERELEHVRTVRMRSVKRTLPWIVGIAVIAGGAWALWPDSSAGPEEQNHIQVGQDFSKSIPNQGQDHMREGERSPAPYNSNPPTSGPHWPDPLRDGVYDSGKPDEAAIHSLEHGRIWISYRSSIPEAAKEKIKELARSQVRVIVTVRDANDTDIALAAWTRLDAFNLNADGSFDEGRILDFIQRYRDKGPEYIPAMTGKEY